MLTEVDRTIIRLSATVAAMEHALKQAHDTIAAKDADIAALNHIIKDYEKPAEPKE